MRDERFAAQQRQALVDLVRPAKAARRALRQNHGRRERGGIHGAVQSKDRGIA
jgi:hypothetical protein